MWSYSVALLLLEYIVLVVIVTSEALELYFIGTLHYKKKHKPLFSAVSLQSFCLSYGIMGKLYVLWR
jgi:hypothetical protein